MAAAPEQFLSRGNDKQLEWAERWLSAERLAPYLAACERDMARALDLYEWNIGLGQVLMRDISHFEVALRNAYDRVLCDGWGSGWMTDDSSPVRTAVMRRSGRGELDVNRINRRTIDAVVDQLPDGAPHGSAVANLTLGFWVHLSDRSREAVVWRTALFRAWPKGTNRRDLQLRLYGILRVRNRVAHAERLFDPNREELSPLRADEDAISLLRALCPEAAERLYGDGKETPVELFCRERPAPSNVRL